MNPQTAQFTRYARIDPAVVPSAFAVPIDEVTADIGIFDDDSMDDLVTQQVLTAESICSRFLGRPVLERAVTDFYRSVGAFELSTLGAKTTGITCSRQKPDGTAEDVRPLETDDTGRHLVVIPPDGPFDVSDNVRNPVSVTYDAGFINEDDGWPVVRQAVKWYVGTFFYNRGRQDVNIDTSPMERLLMPYREEAF